MFIPSTLPMLVRSIRFVCAASFAGGLSLIASCQRPADVAQAPAEVATGRSEPATVIEAGVSATTEKSAAATPQPAPIPPGPLDGRVVDRHGRAIVGARVFQAGDGPKRIETTTDQEGRFQLEEALRERAALFVEQPGCRFHGQWLDSPGGRLEIVLEAENEPPVRMMRMLPPLLSRERRLELVRNLAEEWIAIGRALNPPQMNPWAVEFLARIDPLGAKARLDRGEFGEPLRADSVHRAMANALCRVDLDAAVDVINGIGDGERRAEACLKCEENLPENEHDGRRRLLVRAVQEARALGDLRRRATLEARAGERLWQLGDRELGESLIRESLWLGKQANSNGKPRGSDPTIAGALARVDLEAALAYVREEGPFEKLFIDTEIEKWAIIKRIVESDPSEAERLFCTLGDASRSHRYDIAFCQLLAQVDLARAHKVAASLPTRIVRGRALLAMAEAIADASPRSAEELLLSAVEEFEASARAGDFGRTKVEPSVPEEGLSEFEKIGERLSTSLDELNEISPAQCTFLSLPLAEKLAPQRTHELFWRALALRESRAPPSKDSSAKIDRMRQAEIFAVALYDRELAAKMQPLKGQDQEVPIDERDFFTWRTMTILDPGQGIADAKRISSEAERRTHLVLLGLFLLEEEADLRKEMANSF